MSTYYPELSELQRLDFPPADSAPHFGPACHGGNLSPGFILSAYEQGYFPWYNEGDPVLWWSPDPRFVLYPQNIYMGKRLRRYLGKAGFYVSIDLCFHEVIRLCKEVRKDNTWIDEQLIDGYSRLHDLGYAHSFEVWEGENLVGGLYGVRTGSVFSGESMFSLRPNASKAALVKLCESCIELEIGLIDCQVETEYLDSMGASEIPRQEYLHILSRGLERLASTQWYPVPKKKEPFHPRTSI